MRVVFAYPSWTQEYGLISHFARRAATWPPLNLALLAAVTEQHGHEVHMVDGEADRLTIPKLVKRVAALKPDLVGLTGMSPFFHQTKLFSEQFKELCPDIPVAVGGAHITIMKEKALADAIDYGFIGDAEYSFPQVLECLENNHDVSDVKGIVYRRNGDVVDTGRQVVDKDLDLLPFPARHLLPMHKYKLGTLRGRLNFTSIQTFRGCPWKCIFCASDALNTTRISRRSASSLVAEIKEVMAQWEIRHFMFVDDVLTLHRKHIVELCESIISENLDITFEGSTRANLLDEDLVKLMKKAGLIRLSFGLETVDSEMRKTMKKKVPLRAYTEANQLLNDYNIEALNSVMIGLPGETRKNVEKTLEFLRNAREVKQANFAIAVPYPGTEFHDMAVSDDHGIELLSDDFSEYRRYGSAVTNVNGLTPQDLINLQNEGFVSIYAAPWRWKPMLRKHGLLGGLLMLGRVAKLMLQRTMNMSRAFRTHPGMP